LIDQASAAFLVSMYSPKHKFDRFKLVQPHDEIKYS